MVQNGGLLMEGLQAAQSVAGTCVRQESRGHSCAGLQAGDGPGCLEGCKVWVPSRRQGTSSSGGLHGNKLVPAGRRLGPGLGPGGKVQQEVHVEPARRE